MSDHTVPLIANDAGNRKRATAAPEYAQSHAIASGVLRDVRRAASLVDPALETSVPTTNPRAVAQVEWEGYLKRIRLEPGALWLSVPLSACVSEGDQVRLQDGDAWVICKNGECQFLRPYLEKEVLRIGGLEINVLVKETTEEQEHVACASLADFHYRGHKKHGRTARLIVRTFHPLYPIVIGYISELSASLHRL
jgi:hypothetical protein